MRSVVQLMIHGLLLAALLAVTAEARSPAMPLDEGWQYRWGDSPIAANGVPEWTLDALESPNWSNIDFPSNPPDRASRQNAWFRTVLPEENWWDPVLYIYSVDLITEVYLDGERIYHYGTFDDQGHGRFVGWPWHMIPLPEGFGGKPIYFRVWSNYSDIGLWGEVTLTNRQDLILTQLSRSAESLVVSGFSLMIALLTLLFAGVDRRRSGFADISLFAFASGLMILSGSPASQLLWDQPLVWDYIGAGSYYCLPIAIALLLEQWLPMSRQSIVRCVWQLHLVYLVGALGFSALGLVNLSTTFPVFDVLLLGTLAVLFTVVARDIRRVTLEQRVLIAVFALYSILLIIDMAVAHSFLPWRLVPLSWGGLAFTIVATLVALQRYRQAQRDLIHLNESLERKVEERTRALEALSYEDTLTGLKNRRYFNEFYEREVAIAQRNNTPLSLIMADLDHFKAFNDRFGHEAGDKALQIVAEAIRRHFRETDIGCRYGGEEFVIILPGCRAEDTAKLTERLLADIRQTPVLHQGRNLGRLSLSAGIAAWPEHGGHPEELLTLADQALYRAKGLGRDRACLHAASTTIEREDG
ncbi:GGDEF domain-containing protein [Saccharospirillum salsuginis]|nr:GGDEF domain-containing protein [Saccharospirillum salsuginis]